MLELFKANRVVIVAAHPDDETIGAGALLGTLHNVHIIHTTDGSPLDLTDARRSGFNARDDYAQARRRELECALRLAGVPVENTTNLNFTDQQTMHQLPELCSALADEFTRLKPDAILTHPYEGGHPDHDSTALAVHKAYSHHDRIFEMTSYHSECGAMVTGEFLPNGEPEAIHQLSQEQQVTKRRMLDCFQSQASVLQYFPLLPERFRRAPRYDFTQPPHAGRLHYEKLPWGITGEIWRRLAAECLAGRR